eukprot:9395358-Alexandrium_andersonii.AAC.1
MSASLVGSEMCIRDSAHAAQVRPTRFCTRRPLGPLSKERSTGGNWAMPVSYTHLTLPTICSV